MTGVTSPPLWQLSAAELVAAFRDGTTTPEAALDATLARIEEINPRVNAIVTLDADGARRAAQASAYRWRANKPLGPLDGIPITIKDNILVRCMRSTWGSRLYAGFVPTTDETPVARLRDAGVVILGKTNVPEFTLHGYTDNALFGPTRNPWNLELTPGGSSGGAVAAVATGMGPIAIGTDGGGSIRRPAAHTGLIGFKPSRGMIPRDKGFPPILHDFEVVGPIAHSIEDIVAAMTVMAGADFRNAETERPQGPYRILYIPAFGDAPVDAEIAAAVADVAGALEQQGHRVERREKFTLARPVDDIWPVISQTGLAWLMAQHGDPYDQIGTALAEMARNGKRYTGTDYVNALDTIRKLEQEFEEVFEQFDVLLTPATAAMPWAATVSHPETIAGYPVGPRGHAVFTPFANALGLPAISLPCRSWPQDMPIGFQLVGRRSSDANLIEFAWNYLDRTSWVMRWPDISASVTGKSPARE